MDLRSIISVSGMSGLYKALTQSRTGVIVESLIDKKRTMLSSNHKISSLDNISVFTTDKDVLIEEVLLKMKEKQTETVDTKADTKVLKEKFKTILPDFDEQRVHDSDIKKMFTWFNILRDIAEVWVEKKVEDGDNKPVIPAGGDKPQHHAAKKESGKMKSQSPTIRANIPQKKGGS